ncbi:MAG TPA: DUF4337 domain-containing protein [Zoogloea sp.]|uniref:DUF4337 domain-containing protein n=1 Tax=Zoogloea sp. TaxID=49181 RepID=UPI002BA604BE|nr:DUF4337 domain-containing protein [Zoogloea sp.]HMV62424.1 DUF4337 domain-containing protein [Rhodocyclaceae bacterium]HMW51966.1 DUF4337 domain-containing protein [Rhodocyclaceae bacterium]HNI47835.1 DUF4337 domain-containing protein [Zoogloea sp.]
MSGDHFHVHGPHDHAVEHAAEHGGGDPFASRIAAMTAILATLGALFSYAGGATQNDALMHKNEAAIRKTEASNRWGYYQAKSAKQNLAELGVSLTTGEIQTRYTAEIERYKQEKQEIKSSAEELEKAAIEAEEASEHAMHAHHRWAQAMTAMQVAISLAAITLLTRRRWMQWTSVGVATAGCAIAGLALAGI